MPFPVDTGLLTPPLLMVALVAVRVEIPGKTLQELFRVFRFSAGLVLIEYDGRPIVPACPIQPHIALGLGPFPRLMEYLKGGLIGVEHLALHQLLAQLLVHWQ